MFENAIPKALVWTKPILSVSRFYGSSEVLPGTATCIVVNQDGWILTCKHVLEHLLASIDVAKRREGFREALSLMGSKPKAQAVRSLEKQFGFGNGLVFELLSNFPGIVDTFTGITYHAHPTCDVALVRLDGFTSVHVTEFPRFAKENQPPAHGSMLCKLGFPFPQFTHFEYDKAIDTIRWLHDAYAPPVFFPLEGMVTRHLSDSTGNFGFEMSTPGLKGQSGGPVFDSDAIIRGMQYATWHLDLDFDVSMTVRRGARMAEVSSTPFLNTGLVVSSHTLTAFMSEKGVRFETAP